MGKAAVTMIFQKYPKFGQPYYTYLTNISKLAYLYFFRVKTFHALTNLTNCAAS